MTMTLHAARLPLGAAMGLAALAVRARADTVLNASPMADRWPIVVALVLAGVLIVGWFRSLRAREARQTTPAEPSLDEAHQETEADHPVPREVMNDLNNSLATIAYAIDLSLKQDLPEKSASYLMTALSAVERGQQLTDRMIRVAEQSDGAVATRSVATILDNVKALVGPTLAARISLNVVCEDQGLALRCNQSKLETALVGFVVRKAVSMKANGRSGQITIKARFAGSSSLREKLENQHDTGTDFVEIIVFEGGVLSDAGVTECVSSVPATRLDMMTGLGREFAGANDFAREAGGCISGTSGADRDTSIGFILPLDAGTEGSLRNQNAAPQRGIGETIFVVEDEAMFLLMLQEQLEDLGYRVISATSGEAAMGLIEQGVAFDLVITDVILPGEINGFDLATKIRDQHHRAEVLYMSGYSGFTKAEMGQVEAPFLRKPCAPEDLAAAVRSALIKRMN